MFCIMCGSELENDNGLVCKKCIDRFKQKPDDSIKYNPLPSGWVCPKCGKVYSPSWFECYVCNAPKYVITTTGNVNCKIEAFM